MAVSLEELEKRLWDAANALRGPVDPADFKTYVFPILFWKWISDTYDWERAQAVTEYGEDVDPEVEADFHKFDVPAGAHWREVTTKTANLGAAVNKALGALEQANPDSLAGIFGDAAWGNKERLPETALVNLINAFNGMTLNPDEVSHDLLGQGYEYLLKNFADESGKKAGEFFTPREVVSLLVRILDPQPGESIYDPACGSGGMLVETINTVREHGGDTRTLRLYGQEVNLTTSAIARMNLFLHDIEDFKIVRGDTLRAPGLRQADGRISEFDVVLANPPFSLKNWGADAWAADSRSTGGVPPATNGDFAWIQHMVASMKSKNGRLGVVMPHGVLTRGAVEARIREELLRSDLVEAVIGLPPNLFYNTTLPACILVLSMNREASRRGHVLFIDASRLYSRGRAQNYLLLEHAGMILDAYRTGTSNSMATRLVPMSEIEANHYDLNIWTYAATAGFTVVDSLQPIADWQILAGVTDLAISELQAARHQLTDALEASAQAAVSTQPLSTLLEKKKAQTSLEDGVEYPALGVTRDGKGLFVKEPFIGGETTYKKLTQVAQDDVVLRSITAWEAPVGVAGFEHAGHFVSGVFPVFSITASAAVDSGYLALVFRQPWFWDEMRIRTKGSVLRRKTLSADDFLDISVPLPDIALQREVAVAYRNLNEAIAAIGKELSAFESLAGSLGHAVQTDEAHP